MNNVTTAEKLAVVERLIVAEQRAAVGSNRKDVLISIASELRGRLDSAPSVALAQIETRLNIALRSKTSLGYGNGQMVALANEVLARWGSIKPALERFGAEVESMETVR